jgi:large subunit ribosomal protein L13
VYFHTVFPGLRADNQHMEHAEKMKTVVMNPSEIQRSWHVVDATGVPLGRLASAVAGILIGKGKPAYSPNQDHGDYVVVINSDKVGLTGRKMDTKTYFSHSGFPGGVRVRTLKDMMQRDPAWVVRQAIRGMVPRNTPRGRAILKKLHVYAGARHPHTAQQPQALSVHKAG